MKVIDLLNKIANDEEVPEKIKWRDKIWTYDNKDQDYEINDTDLLGYGFSNHRTLDFINDEVEILEEPKGIPEKLKIEQDTPSSNYYIRNEQGTKCALTKHSKIIADKVNQLIDYLKSKGE